jgi:ubiquinone/menaquinone biosynthesis C-methylase UbiE
MSDVNNWTGERLETFIYNDNTVEHLHRYALAQSLVKGKKVLDIASGEGYGSNLLSFLADEVIGVDIDPVTVEKASKKYQANNLQFKVGSADDIPIESNSVDVVISFETIEHHDKHHEMMREIKRVLKPGGLLLMSSPDKKYYSDATGHRNPFHVKELYEKEFKDLISTYFNKVAFYHQNNFRGSIIMPENSTGRFSCLDGSYEFLSEPSQLASLYLIAIASDQEIVNDFQITGFSNEIIESKNSQALLSQYRQQGAEWIMNSKSYRLGKLILSPFSFLKKKD